MLFFIYCNLFTFIQLEGEAEQKLEFPSTLGQEVKISTCAMEQNVLRNMGSETIEYFFFSQLSTKSAYFHSVAVPSGIWCLNCLLCPPAHGGQGLGPRLRLQHHITAVGMAVRGARALCLCRSSLIRDLTTGDREG